MAIYERVECVVDDKVRLLLDQAISKAIAEQLKVIAENYIQSCLLGELSTASAAKGLSKSAQVMNELHTKLLKAYEAEKQ